MALASPARLDATHWQAMPTTALLVKGLDPQWLHRDEAQAEVISAAEKSGRVTEAEVDAGQGLVRLHFSRLDEAVLVRGLLDGRDFGDCSVTVLFANEESTRKMSLLQVPALTKQFLISPPASPPIGWEPVVEDPPVVNKSLVDAIMDLDMGVPREVHTGRPGQPSINVVNCSSPSPPHSPGEISEKPCFSTLGRSSPRPSIILEDDTGQHDLLADASLVLRPSPDGLRAMPQTRRPPPPTAAHDSSKSG